jgi:hypothetical protein
MNRPLRWEIQLNQGSDHSVVGQLPIAEKKRARRNRLTKERFYSSRYITTMRRINESGKRMICQNSNSFLYLRLVQAFLLHSSMTKMWFPKKCSEHDVDRRNFCVQSGMTATSSMNARSSHPESSWDSMCEHSANWDVNVHSNHFINVLKILLVMIAFRISHIQIFCHSGRSTKSEWITTVEMPFEIISWPQLLNPRR